MDGGSREGAAAVASAADRDGGATLPPLPPLGVSGLVVAGADLAAALRPWLPQLVEIEALDRGRFLLRLAGGAAPGAGRE